LPIPDPQSLIPVYWLLTSAYWHSLADTIGCARIEYVITQLRHKEASLEPNELAHTIVNAAADKKASNIVLLDLRSVALIADYFVVCDGQSNRQLRAIAEAIVEASKEQGERPLQTEGTPESGWMLVDFGAVVVHIFSPELRNYYALEELWKDASVVVRIQ
jgi:ribosome-associated protein